MATEVDYKAVRDLVADLISDGIGATVSPTTRETVECVRDLLPKHDGGVTVLAVAEKLGLDRSAASRRLQTARERGYISNQEDRRGRPARYVLADPLPDEVDLLPHHCTPEDSESPAQAGVCSGAVTAEGKEAAS